MARILVVDDDEMDRLVERMILEELGHELYFAKDGEDALGIYQERDIDVVVTDLKMPGVDGLSLIRQIRDLHPGAEVIVVSGLSRSKLEQAHDLGARDTLVKPVDHEALIEAVTNAVQRAASDGWG